MLAGERPRKEHLSESFGNDSRWSANLCSKRLLGPGDSQGQPWGLRIKILRPAAGLAPARGKLLEEVWEERAVMCHRVFHYCIMSALVEIRAGPRGSPEEQLRKRVESSPIVAREAWENFRRAARLALATTFAGDKGGRERVQANMAERRPRWRGQLAGSWGSSFQPSNWVWFL